MSILARRCLGRSRFVEELVENWQIEHRQAMFARDVEELVSECLQLGELILHGCKSLVERLFDEQIDDIDAAGEMMRSSITRTLRTFQIVEEEVGKAECKGYNIEKSSSFRKVARELHQVQAELETTWPSVDADLIEKSQAAYRKGEYQKAEELLGEPHNCSPEAH